MSFPTFPNFRKLVPEDRDIYLDFYKRVEPYSDFSFNNLLIWLDLKNDLEVAQLKDCVILRFTNPFVHDRVETAYTMLGSANCLEVVQLLFAHQRSQGEEARLVMVPECVVSNMLHTHDLPQNLVIRASSDHCDYIFDVAEVNEAKGGKYEQLRRNLRIFTRENPGHVQIQNFDLRDHRTHAYLLQALKMWQQDEGFVKNDPTFDEEKALQHYFRFNEFCPAECQGFFLDGKLFGFSIIHRPPQQDWVIFNHLKCTRDVPHGYDYIYYATVHQLEKQGVKYMNFEQDLGIPGLRVHKRQLGRSDFLYRYDISEL